MSRGASLVHRRTQAVRLIAFAGLAGALSPDFGVEAQATPGEGLPVVEHTLDNGMRLLVLERRGAPTVALVVEFGVGGANEVRGSTGIAHLLEHMLFKGTSSIGTTDVESERELFLRMDALDDTISLLRSRGEDSNAARVRELSEAISALEDEARGYVVAAELEQILATNGARGLNASTDHDATRYFVELPSSRIELWFALEANRMSDPVLREFYTERDVVAEERRMRVDSEPGGTLTEAHLAAAFRVHPYGAPVVGSMTDIQSLTRRQAGEYHRRFYGASNAVVAIVGDVRTDHVIDLAERYFSDVPAGEVPAPVQVVEPEQVGERRIEVEFDAEPLVRIGWHTVAQDHPDMPALVVLTSILAGGRTSRLHNRLVRADRSAAVVSASMGPGARYPQLFTVEAAPRAPHTTDEVEQAVYQELARLAESPPTDREIQGVRNRVEAENVRRLTSHLGLAFQLAGSAAAFGDWRATFRFATQLQGVAPEDIQRVVRAYFTAANRTVATLVPSGTSERTR